MDTEFSEAVLYIFQAAELFPICCGIAEMMYGSENVFSLAVPAKNFLTKSLTSSDPIYGTSRSNASN